VVAGVAALLLLSLAGAAWWMVSRAGSPRDLGVRYTEADYQSAVEKAGIALDNVPADGEYAGTEMVYSGSKPIDATFTQAELSAALSMHHHPDFPARDVQVRLLGGNQAEASGLFTYAGVTYPVYVKGDAALVAGDQATGSIQAAEVAGWDVPPEYFHFGEEYLIPLVNSRLARMEGLDIQSVEVVDGQARVVGSVPAEAKRMPSGQ
jgi:hypothetical protein